MPTSFPRETKTSVIEKYRNHDKDSGSPEVQVAVLTERIRYLTDHLSRHKKDHATRRGLLMLVGRRTKLLRYLRSKSHQRYVDLIQSLGLRK